MPVFITDNKHKHFLKDFIQQFNTDSKEHINTFNRIITDI